MKTFLLIIRSSLLKYGGLGLQSLEIESVTQASKLFVPFCNLDTLIRALLKTILEYVHLELGITKLFLLLDFVKFDGLVTDL